jgi:3-hydroxyisobutyrate dehydrogenase-like beta-hydroxyacid dehydrogenase
VLSVNAAAVALDVADAAGGALSPGQLYADLNTASAGVKLALQRAVAPSGALFADVALLGAVPRTGLRTPALASGTGAGRFADVFRPLGMPVDVVGEEAGAAAARKLVRSVFMKGLAASIVESLEAAAACDLEEWLREEIVRALDTPGAQLLERLVSGTQRHAARRRDEMAAAAELLSELGVEPRIALAAEALLEDVGRARAGGESGARPARS